MSIAAKTKWCAIGVAITLAVEHLPKILPEEDSGPKLPPPPTLREAVREREILSGEAVWVRGDSAEARKDWKEVVTEFQKAYTGLHVVVAEPRMRFLKDLPGYDARPIQGVSMRVEAVHGRPILDTNFTDKKMQ